MTEPSKRTKAGGRKKGTPNKTPAVLKTALLEAFDKVGGVEYLVAVAKDDPKSFLAILGKLVPSEIKAELTTTGLATVVVKDFTRSGAEDGDEA